MDSQFRFKNNTRVKLRSVDPTFYMGMAKTGNEGWIIKHRVDKFGLPEVYIRWDTDHWAYNEQPDCWTYEDHFDLAQMEENVAQEDDKKSNVTPEDIARLKQIIARYEGGPSETEMAMNQSPEQLSELDLLSDELDEAHANQMEKSQRIVQDAEAFFTVAVHRGQHADAPMGELVIHTAGSSQSPETDALLGAQLSSMAATFHNETALMNIRFLTDVGEE